ncbi:MAG: tetratricopeptide repeat protein [Acidobacteriota bacterium]
MKLAALLMFLAGSVAAAGPAQNGRQSRPASPPPAAAASAVADAYDQYLLGLRLERDDNVEGAIAAFKRAVALDPTAAEVSAELSALYMRQNRVAEAMTAAEQALKVAPDNLEAHRVLGTIYAALSEADTRTGRGTAAARSDENAAKAIDHLEQAGRRPAGEPDPNLLANLARLYVRTGAYTKAIPMLRGLVDRERGWQDGVTLLAEAYGAAGKNAEAIAWLEEAAPDDPRLYATLGDFYDRERRWKDAAGAYAIAVLRAPRNVALKVSYAQDLLNVGGPDGFAKARDVLNEAMALRPTGATEQRALYLLSQAHRRGNDLSAAEATARRLITSSRQSPWGYFALAEVLQDRQQYQAIVDALQPALKEMRSRSMPDVIGLGLLLPHVGFAYEQLSQFDAAVGVFDEAHRLAPDDLLVTSYLIQANVSAKKYGDAIELARVARVAHPEDLRLARLQAQALRQNGQADRAVAVLQEVLDKQADRPLAYVVLAQGYMDANRGPDAVSLLERAQVRFPADTSVTFELGAVLEKQKRFADAEAAFRRVLTREPDNAPTLNYLGYMLADRGERLDESVGYLKKALELDPDNGSYLDSLGWAYFKGNKLDLADDNLKRAADQLKSNSVIQDHYGEVLAKLGRFDEAIAAWTRALAGDGDSIDRTGIDRKIRAAQQKLKK